MEDAQECSKKFFTSFSSAGLNSAEGGEDQVGMARASPPTMLLSQLRLATI